MPDAPAGGLTNLSSMDVILQGLVSGILMGFIYALIAAGFTMILGVMNVVNFSHGNFVMVGMYIAYFLGITRGVDPFASIGVAAPIMFVVGAIVYFMAIRPVLGQPQYAQMMVTFGLLIIIENIIIWIFGGEYRSLNTPYTTAAIPLGNVRVSVARLFASGAASVILSGLFLFLYRTDLGRAVRACADEPESAQGVGINLNKVFFIAFALGSILAGMAGCIIMPFQVCSPSTGVDAVIKAFIIVTVGGLGSIPGALIGGLIIGVTESVASVLWSPSFGNVLVFAILIAVVAWKPTGVFSRAR
jgi:branched-chain amino acid transport system permease protein